MYSLWTAGLESVTIEAVLETKEKRSVFSNSKKSKSKNEHKNMTGTIKTLTDRGFGFIAREGETKDLFFHSKDLQGVAFDDLRQGDSVTFDVIEGDKGPAATNVARA